MFCFLVLHSSYSAVTRQEAQEVFNNLQRVSGIYTKFSVSSNKSVNAESTPTGIVIYQGMLNFLRNKNELAIILGHELAHTDNGDDGSTPPREYRADKEGFFMAVKAGYNSCAGAVVFKRMAVRDGNRKSVTHPRSLDRYKVLRKYCK